MDAPHLVRVLRQQRGLSQRAFAAAVGISASRLGDWESGRTSPRWSDLEPLLQHAGWELVPIVREPAGDRQLRDHLQLSLTRRLLLSLGVRGPVVLRRARGCPAEQLCEAAAGRPAALDDAAALGVWLPTTAALPLHVRLGPLRPGCRLSTPPGPDLQVELVAQVEDGLVPVTLQPGITVLVPSPDILASRCADPVLARRLRQAGRLLDDERGRDDVGRRAPAHRVPRESREASRLTSEPAYDRVERLPSPLDSRAWRLGAPVSLDQWLTERGLPRRRPRQGDAWPP